MDPLSALSIASTVVQFVQLGVKVAKTFAEYNEACRGELPRSLEGITTRLPLLIKALDRIRDESEVSGYDPEQRLILHGVVLGCFRLVRELEVVAVKIRPEPGEKLTSKVKKVFNSLKSDERIQDIDRGLQSYIQVLILHRLVDRANVQVVIQEDSEYFEVKEKRVANIVLRELLLHRVDECFYAAVRSHQTKPEIVILQGNEGAGKTQLALSYCHQAHKLKQFQTVFWLDASTPTTLELGLESLAATIRRSKVGTKREKLDFLYEFLVDRWHPWLLVLDNYQLKEYDQRALTQHLPDKGHGAILITTRDWDIPPIGTVLKVHQYRTPAEESELRFTVTKALYHKKLDIVKEALENGMSVDSRIRTVHVDSGDSLINLSALQGYDDAVKLFLNLGANPKLVKTSESLLACAARSGSVSTLALCLDYEEQTGQIYDSDDYAWAFRRALDGGHVDILKLLLTRRKRRFNGEDPRICTGISTAAENGQLESLQLLQSQNCFPQSEQVKANALCKAAENQHLEIVQFIVSEFDTDSNIPDSSGQPALYHAISRKPESDSSTMQEIMTYLLKAGASPDIGRTWDNRTTLHHAAAYGNVAIVKLLLEHGADVTVEIRDSDHLTPLMMAVNYKMPASYPLLTNVELSDPETRTRYFSRPLFMAAAKGDRDLVLVLQKKGVLDLVDAESGDTALLMAIKHDHAPLARMLVRNKIITAYVDREGKTALALAAERGMELLIKDLSKAADFPGLEVCDAKGFTPLMLAAAKNQVKAVSMLLSLGADRGAMNQYGEIALDIAEEKSYEDIVKLLEDTVLV